jgi:hypothetical protein
MVLMAPDDGYGIGFDASNQMIQEVVELENLVRGFCDIREKGRVGSVDCDAHAIGIKKMIWD